MEGLREVRAARQNASPSSSRVKHELSSRAIRPGQLVKFTSENGEVRLDIGLASFLREPLAMHDVWCTRFFLRRLDPPD